MDTERARLRRAAANAAAIGNHSAAIHFSERASACQWVAPQDWRPHVCHHGIPLRGADLTDTATWRTRAQAQAAARSIGWPVGAVTRVTNPLHGDQWALVDGRFGLVSAHWFRTLNRNN